MTRSEFSPWLGVLFMLALAAATAAPLSSQSPAGPAVPFEDVGACPFEGCVYRDWVATDTVRVWAERRTGGPSLFTIRKGERVAAMTGIVITTRAGRVEFREPVDLFTESGPLRIEPGQLLYLLTYRGEGETKAWFNGRLYDRVDGAMEFFNGRCEIDPSHCAGRILERPQSVWWVQVRNARGRIGWTNQPDKFGNKDRYGPWAPLHTRSRPHFH